MQLTLDRLVREIDFLAFSSSIRIGGDSEDSGVSLRSDEDVGSADDVTLLGDEEFLS